MSKSNLFFFITIITTLLLLIKDIFPEQKVRVTPGIDLFAANCHWENPYSREIFDDLGLGIYLIPSIKVSVGKLNFYTSFLTGSFNFKGPDALTITSPDHDIDTGYESNMKREDVNFLIGRKFYQIVELYFGLKYFHMNIEGELKWPEKKVMSTLDYLEKGFLYGGIISNKLPLGKSPFLGVCSFGYFEGLLQGDYSINNLMMPYNAQKDIDAKLVKFNIGLGFQFHTQNEVIISYFSEFYYKEVHSDKYKYSSDLRFRGIKIRLAHTFN